MKKKLLISRKRTGIKTSRSNRSKFIRSYKKVEMLTIAEPGPSKAIKYDKDGKVVEFISWSKKNHQNPTKIAKQAMEENKRTRKEKKELIKKILMEAGYDYTIRYTRKEKKKFTRAVKNKLFVKPKPVTLTKEQILERVKQKQISKKMAFEQLRHLSPLGKKRVQKGFTAAELSVKEKEDERLFAYTLRRKREDDPMRSEDFLTDHILAKSREDAKNKLKPIVKKYLKDDNFTGVSVTDSKDNNIIFYSPLAFETKKAA